MIKTMLFAFLTLIAIPVLASESLTEIWRNNRAVDYTQQKKLVEAHEEFSSLVTDDPFHPVLQFNLGSSYIAVEDPKKAIKMYEEILKNPHLPPQLSFSVHYNLGILYSADKELDLALKNYQKALAFFPDSKEVKTNIELLFKEQQGGGGKGDKKENKDEKGDQDQEQEKEPQEFDNKPQQPDQFNDKEMSKEDVNKILEELKKQEQNIKAKHERKGGKEADREKSW